MSINKILRSNFIIYSLDVDECINSTLNKCETPSKCENLIGGYRCNCPVGYEKNGSYACKDIDECSTMTHSCAHTCINKDGSFQCSCKSGYTLAPDNANCKIDIQKNNTCNAMNCSHICKFESNQIKGCECPEGYRLESDGKTCKSTIISILALFFN